MKRTACCLAAIALSLWAMAQRAVPVSRDYDFALYLIDNDLKKDAAKLISGDYAESDTLLFLRGWIAYQMKELETAKTCLYSVPGNSVFYEKSFFYANAVAAHTGDFQSPAQALEKYDGPFGELCRLQAAGLALLRDDAAAYREAASGFKYSDYALAQPELALDAIYKRRYETRPKSPALAAAASAVVPGLGKIYAGATGEGISAFLLTGAMGAICAEHWIKDGASDWKTIVPGLLCAVLYIGNIYGSYVSVSIYNTKLKDAQNTAVLYNIHIPLRSVFK